MKEEIWKSVVNFEESYEVSNLGRFKRLSRYTNNKNGKNLLKERINNNNVIKSSNKYINVSLCSEGICKTFLLHRLIMEAFTPNIENKPCVNHINGIKHDNRLENLEWCNYSENAIHAFKIGLSKSERKVLQYSIEGEFIKEWSSLKDIRSVFNMNINTLVKSCKHEIGKYTAHGYIWTYYNGEDIKSNISINKVYSKVIIVTDLITNEKIEYLNSEHTAKALDVSKATISLILNGKIKKAVKLKNKSIRLKYEL